MKSLASPGGRKPALAQLAVFKIEYLSSPHRGIAMGVEIHEAKSAIDALAYARDQFVAAQLKYGARGYRVRDSSGAYHGSDLLEH